MSAIVGYALSPTAQNFKYENKEAYDYVINWFRKLFTDLLSGNLQEQNIALTPAQYRAILKNVFTQSSAINMFPKEFAHVLKKMAMDQSFLKQYISLVSLNKNFSDLDLEIALSEIAKVANQEILLKIIDSTYWRISDDRLPNLFKLLIDKSNNEIHKVLIRKLFSKYIYAKKLKESFHYFYTRTSSKIKIYIEQEIFSQSWAPDVYPDTYKMHLNTMTGLRCSDFL